MGRRIKITEEELIKLLSDHKVRGMEILYDNYSSALYGVIHRIVQSDEIAEDILQEVFLRIWKNFSQYSAEKGRLFTWMIQVARNMALDKVRSRDYVNSKKNQPLENFVFYNELTATGSYNPDTIDVRDIVSKLEPEYKEIIDILFFQGYSQADAASKLNIPIGTVKTRSRAAILKLRQKFDAIEKN